MPPASDCRVGPDGVVWELDALPAGEVGLLSPPAPGAGARLLLLAEGDADLAVFCSAPPRAELTSARFRSHGAHSELARVLLYFFQHRNQM